MISVVVFLCLVLSGVSSLKHCEPKSSDFALLKEGIINLILVTSNDCNTCVEQVKSLPEICDKFNEMDVELNVIISHDGKAEFPQNIPVGFTFDNGSISERLEGQGGHIFIFDRCGRLTFQVIQPWVLPNYPFVKAAVLSTHYDNPCGGECNVPLKMTNKKTKRTDPSMFPVYPKLDKVYKSDDLITVNEDGTIPIKIVMHIPHTHVGSNKEYKLIELETGNSNYHGHLEEDEPVFPIEETSDENNQDLTVLSEEGTKPLDQQAGYFTYKTLSSTGVNDNGEEDYVATENESLEEKIDKASNLGVSSEATETSQDEELKEHYQKLLKWVDYII